MVNAVKPRSSLSPIMFGLGIEAEKVFRSKWLLTELNRLGFTITPDEATLNGRLTMLISVCTIDGKSTLHGIGMVVSTTPGRHTQGLTHIPREKRRAVKEVVKGEEIPIIEYHPPEETGLSAVTFKPIVQLKTLNVLPSDLLFEYLWHTSYFLPNTAQAGQAT